MTDSGIDYPTQGLRAKRILNSHLVGDFIQNADKGVPTLAGCGDDSALQSTKVFFKEFIIFSFDTCCSGVLEIVS